MENLTVAHHKINRTKINLDVIDPIFNQILSSYSSKEPNQFRSIANPETGVGYQWGDNFEAIDNLIPPLLEEIYNTDQNLFSKTDSWVLLQPTDSWINNPPHDHLGGGGVVVVVYIMADPMRDSISFFDDTGNEEKLLVSPGDVLIFSGSAKHKPNATMNQDIPRISYNSTFYLEQKETADSKARMAICESCDRLMQPVKICKECYCFMPGKVLIPIVSCPLGKWLATEI
jgi:hypothetical protein